MIRTAAALLAAVIATAAADAQQYLMMPDSLNNRLVLFNTTTGEIENSSYFTLAGNVPLHAMQVGREIWVSEQNGGRVSRWSLTGEPLGEVTGNLTNIRGMELVGNRVYVSRNGDAVEVFDTTGAFQFSFPTSQQAASPFSVLDHQGGLLVGASTTTYDEVHRYTYDGVSQGTFINSTVVNFVEQLSHDADGNVLAASFTGNKVATLNAETGAVVASFPATSARGVHQLLNGNVLWTNGSGVFIYSRANNSSQFIYSGSGRYIDVLDLTPEGPECGPQDFNGDGDAGTDQDIEAFFTCLGGNCCPTCWHNGADFNGDGDVGTDQDIEAFFRVLAGGTC